jgi:hypothetical protein
MHKDPYYTPLYKKKAYYMEKMGAYITNPQLCPKYEECQKETYGKS